MSDYLVINTNQGVHRIFQEQYQFPDQCSGIGILELIKSFVNPVGIEIGSDSGHTASTFLENRQDMYLHCIDPYSNFVDWDGRNYNNNNREEILSIFKSKMKPYENRYSLHRMTSDQAVNNFENESLDFIWIDGLHEYGQVLKDCRNYWSKLKPGGLFCGHDYAVIPGVNKAVNEFANEIKVNIHTTVKDVWYWYKN